MDVEWSCCQDEHKNEFLQVKVFCGHNGEVNSCCLSRDYKLLVTAADDSHLIVWNAVKQSILCELTGHTGPVNCCQFSPDNKNIASASYDTTVKVWETATATCVATLCGHRRSVERVCYSQDGLRLCSSSWDKMLIVWDSQNGALLHRLLGHSDCVKACAFSLDGAMVGSGGWDEEIRVWKLHPTIRDTSERAKWLLRRFKKAPDSNIYVAVMKGHTGNVQCVTFSPAGLMASASWDRSVCLWNPYRAELLKKFLGHTGWVKAVNFTVNSVELASTADDDTIRIWNVVTGKCIKVYAAQTDVAHSCLFSASGNLLTMGSALYDQLEDVPNQVKSES